MKQLDAQPVFYVLWHFTPIKYITDKRWWDWQKVEDFFCNFVIDDLKAAEPPAIFHTLTHIPLKTSDCIIALEVKTGSEILSASSKRGTATEWLPKCDATGSINCEF